MTSSMGRASYSASRKDGPVTRHGALRDQQHCNRLMEGKPLQVGLNLLCLLSIWFNTMYGNAFDRVSILL
jgi:hypothetical protein